MPKNNLQIKTGIVLLIASSVVYALLLVIPFLKVSSAVKLTLVPVIIIIGEIAFWAGTFFLGKELVRRYRSYLNPLKWFRRKSRIHSHIADNVAIRPMEHTDSEQVLEIYRMGIDTKNATFEKNVPEWQSWTANHLEHSRFAAEINGSIAGWVALSSVSKREAYKGVAEVSIYISREHWGKGIGSLLMEKVIESSEENGIWTLFATVFPDNKASMALHKKHEFRIIGTRERISRIDDIWRDTVILERRSRKVGM
jgi:L-amino acid N-acyltransferase YncA